MLYDVSLIFASVGSLAGLFAFAVAGFRHGDRPGDVRISARLAGCPEAGQPAAGQPAAGPPGAGPRRAGDQDRLVIATVVNPSGTPVLAGLRVRRAVLPVWLAGAGGVRVPHWTRRRALRPDRFTAVGAVLPGAAQYTLPAPPGGRRCLLTVVVGQEGARLRAYRLRLGPDCYTISGRDALIMVR
jgi:hypothetical protein